MNPNDTATVAWNLSDPSAFSLDNVTLTNGSASLAVNPYFAAWSGGPAFEANVSQSTNVSETATGLQITANTTNHVPDGDFATQEPWTYANSTDDAVTARWEPSGNDILLGHASPTTQLLWNSLDVYNSTNWTRLAGGNTQDFVIQNSSGGQIQGSGMFKVYINATANGAGNYAGLQWNGPVNWSGKDRLLVWVNVTTPNQIDFNLSALNGGKTYYTTTQTVQLGWQDVEVNLTPLGPDLSSLSQVTFRFLPIIAGHYVLFLDDTRVGENSKFAGTSTVSQTFDKNATTSTSPGTAVFSFDWQRPNQTGVDSGYATVSLGGPNGVGVFTQAMNSSAGLWQHASIDVSGLVAPVGQYTVWLNMTAAANTTGAIVAQVRFRNLGLEFPDRHDGTYLSKAIAVGIPVVFTTASVSLDLPAGTSADVSLNISLPSGSTQFSWNASGTYPLQHFAGSTFQVRVVLRTSFANQTPTLASMMLSGERYAEYGSLTTVPLSIPGPFLHWRTFAAVAEYVALPQDTDVTYAVNTGSGWDSVAPGADLTSRTGSTIQFRVDLMSIMGFYSPRLDSLNTTYDFLGPLAQVSVSPSNQSVVSGGTIQFAAQATDAGGHTNDSVFFAWGTDCPGGTVGIAGLFHAGAPATCNVTAVTVGTPKPFSASVQVTVVPVTPPGSPDSIWPYAVLLAVIAACVLVGYLVVSRHFFTIDDVFLVNRDGRLMSHNTRRILADRDEDILSGMLTAINSFARDTWREENSHVRRFDIGGKKTLVERGEHVFLAAVYSGRVPGWASRDIRAFVDDLERHFGTDFANWTGSPEDLQSLRMVMGRFVTRMRYSRRHVWKGIAG